MFGVKPRDRPDRHRAIAALLVIIVNTSKSHTPNTFSARARQILSGAAVPDLSLEGFVGLSLRGSGRLQLWPWIVLHPSSLGYGSPREVIALAVRWYLRYGLSYRDVEELLAERGIRVDHVTIGGCNASPPTSSKQPGRAAGCRGFGGSSTKRTCGWLAGGPTCIRRSTSTVMSST
jgi:hypothetical protein